MTAARIITGTIGSDLEPYGLGSAEVLAGDPQPTGRVFCRIENETSRLVTGVFSCQPGTMVNDLLSHETIHVLEGEVRIELDTGHAVDLVPGDVATLPKGHRATWTFKTPFKELFILSS